MPCGLLLTVYPAAYPIVPPPPRRYGKASASATRAAASKQLKPQTPEAAEATAAEKAALLREMSGGEWGDSVAGRSRVCG